MKTESKGWITANLFTRGAVIDETLKFCHLHNIDCHIEERKSWLSSTYLVTFTGERKDVTDIVNILNNLSKGGE